MPAPLPPPCWLLGASCSLSSPASRLWVLGWFHPLATAWSRPVRPGVLAARAVVLFTVKNEPFAVPQPAVTLLHHWQMTSFCTSK